jgi:hypothetical protein
MKRRIFKVCLFLLLGAIINVAVAWFFAISCDMPVMEKRWQETVHDNVGHIVEFRTARAARGWRSIWYASPATEGDRRARSSPEPVDLPYWFPEHAQPLDLLAGAPFNSQLWAQAYGWPCLTVYWSRPYDSRGSQWSVHNGIDLTNVPFQRASGNEWPRVLPLGFIWPGFAINTIFYAALLWMMFAFPFVIRRRRRIKRGLCPACAYPVGHSPVCTECGAPNEHNVAQPHRQLNE